MERKTNIDQRLADAVRIALRDFGVEILAEDRLMGVLKDYQGFRDFQHGEFIVRTLIADGAIFRLFSHSRHKEEKLREHINRETQRIARQYGFSYSLIKTVLYSFIDGMGINLKEGAAFHHDTRKEKVESTKSKISLTKPAPSNSPNSIPKSNSVGNNTGISSNNGNIPSHTPDNAMNLFLQVGIAFTLLILGPVLVSKGCESNSVPSDEEIPINVVVDPIEDSVSDTPVEYYYAIEAEAGERHLREMEKKAATEQDAKPEQKTETKKKPIDPRFQHPDGKYKQPYEYMEYFNEDYDDEDEDYDEDEW